MKKKIAKSLIVIAALAVVGGAIAFAVNRVGHSDEKFFHPPYFSPDHRYKAVVITRAGQVGLIAGYFCLDYLSVLPSSVKDEDAFESFRVYSGECHTLADPAKNARINGPELKWLSNTKLRVTYANYMADSDVTTLKSADHGHIQISYETR